jgi:hypothetical protein
MNDVVRAWATSPPTLKRPLDRETMRLPSKRPFRTDRPPKYRAFSLLFWLVSTATLPSATARAELLELPRRNPRARVIQQVGLTEITVEYSSLAVAGRPFWGPAVPEGRLWLMGETPAVRIAFSREVTIGGQKVPAGRYSLLLLPGREAWTFVINSDSNLAETSTDHRPASDLARVTVRPESVPHRERLTFLFSDFDNDGAVLNLEWGSWRASFAIRVNTRAQVLAGIAALDDAWRGYANAARYMLETRKDYQAGLSYVYKSLALKETSYNQWILASLLAATGKYAEAQERAERALAIAAGVPETLLSEVEIGRAVDEWGRAARRAVTASKPGSTTKATTKVPRVPRPSSYESGAAPRATDLVRVVQRGRTEVEGCYARTVGQERVEADQVAMSIRVGATGLVKSVVLNGTRSGKLFEQCVTDVVSRWVFPSSSIEYGAEIPMVMGRQQGRPIAHVQPGSSGNRESKGTGKDKE